MARFSFFLVLLLVLNAWAKAQTWSEEVNHAIDRGVHHLLTYQAEDGSFRARHGNAYRTGETALATYALLKSGLTLDDPAIRLAIKYLTKNEEYKHVYNVSTFIMALDATGSKQFDDYIQRGGKFIERSIDRETDLWSYPNLHANKVDLSNTQFALLGLSVATKHGFKPNRSIWMRVFDAVAETQNADGGFGYRGDLRPHSSGAMTTAGLTVAHLVHRALGKKKMPKVIRDVKDRAWQWMDKVFTAKGNPSRAQGVIEHEYPISTTHPYYNLYYLYGLERVAAFADKKEIGGRNWYQEGALFLLRHQKQNGSWRSIDNTAFALLFLKRATFSGLTGINPLSGRTAPIKWKVSFADSLADGWQKPGFDDGPWQDAWGAIGTTNATNAAVRTFWKTEHVRMRRTFEFTKDSADEFQLYVQHDDDCTIWINGIEAVKLPHYSGGKFIAPEISDAARQSIKKGKNLLAVYGHNLAGGAGTMDVRIDDLGLRTKRAKLEPKEAAKLWWKNPPFDGVPYIERWSVLGPIRDPDNKLLFDSILPDEEASPEPGGRSKKGKWKTHWSRGGFVDLSKSLRIKDDSIYYAFTWLEAKRDTKIVLRFGGDEGYRIFLDGKLLLSHHGNRKEAADERSLPLLLRKGKHRLLIKLGHAKGACGFFCRITDREGQHTRDVIPRLKSKGADLEKEAWAHPDYFDGKNLLGLMEPDSDGKLDFRQEKALSRIAVTGSPIGFPRWMAKGKKSILRDPPAGGRGMAALSWYENKPTRVIRRLSIPSGKPKIALRVAYTPPLAKNNASKKNAPKVLDKEATCQVRIGVWRRRSVWLLERTMRLSSDPKKAWVKLVAPLAAVAGRDVLLIVEVSGTPGGILWLDDFTLKNR